jgi:parallel beta-helix repeat protein
MHTMIIRRLAISVLFLAGLSFQSSALHAETYQTCTGFIDSVPATINSQGVWCLRKHLATSVSSGDIITINTNNVTIDCNEFKIGGLAAGDSSQAVGIHAYQRQNITVRNCNVRGFFRGILLNGGAGHLVEDNRLDNNLHEGIYVVGDNSMVRRNRVFDTGGYPEIAISRGMYTQHADVIDNLVSGVFASTADTAPHGIQSTGSGIVIRGNTVRSLGVAGNGTAVGILVTTSARVSDNQVINEPVTDGYGIYGGGVSVTSCDRNLASGFATAALFDCADGGGNTSL